MAEMFQKPYRFGYRWIHKNHEPRKYNRPKAPDCLQLFDGPQPL